MTILKYTFKDDTLFKSLFVKYPNLLKRLVAELLGIALDSIGQFEITNPEIPPESLGDKFCRLDINMTVDGQRVDLEIQVKDKGDFPERTLFYWARDYSSALPAGGMYRELPRVVIISIMAFNLFDCEEYHSEFQPLEVTRHTLLTDRQSLHYFELPKLPEVIDTNDELKLWLSLFKVETEEELKQIEELEVPVMQQAIGAYRSITATPEFRERARLYEKARHDEAQALGHAAEVAAEVERAKWQGVVVDMGAALADKDAALADKDAENALLRKQLAALQTQLGEGK
ncbi:MAG: Rpn family recombination-promoting nuclease/putative transposase [Clostridiales bacterium]|nr:Rpn family recombination-promoting nuclease/putative transposase [Clostridiales bacterium]